MDLQLEKTELTIGEDLSWMAMRKGMDTARPVVLDLSAFTFPLEELASNPTGFVLPSGTRLIKLGSGRYGPYGGGAGSIEVTRTATAGTVRLRVLHDDGADPTDWSADTAVVAATTAAQLKALIETVTDYEVGVTGAAGGPFIVTGLQGDLEIDDANATGGEVTITDDSDATVTADAGLLLNSQLARPGNITGLVAAAMLWEGVVRTNRLPDGTYSDEVDDQFAAACPNIRFELREA
jgi:hypothetical protein